MKEFERTYETQKSQAGAKIEDEVDKGELASFAGHQKDETNAPIFSQVTINYSSLRIVMIVRHTGKTEAFQRGTINLYVRDLVTESSILWQFGHCHCPVVGRSNAEDTHQAPSPDHSSIQCGNQLFLPEERAVLTLFLKILVYVYLHGHFLEAFVRVAHYVFQDEDWTQWIVFRMIATCLQITLAKTIQNIPPVKSTPLGKTICYVK